MIPFTARIGHIEKMCKRERKPGVRAFRWNSPSPKWVLLHSSVEEATICEKRYEDRCRLMLEAIKAAQDLFRQRREGGNFLITYKYLRWVLINLGDLKKPEKEYLHHALHVVSLGATVIPYSLEIRA